MVPGPGLILSALTLLAVSPAPAMKEVPLTEFAAKLETDSPQVRTSRGIELEIGSTGALVGIREPRLQQLEVTVISDSLFTVTYASVTPQDQKLFGPPWRYVPLRPGEATLRMDFLQTPGWSLDSLPVLNFGGSGHIIIERVRAIDAPTNRDAASGAHDWAYFWAPESIADTTINSLTPPTWSASRGIYLAEILAGAFICVAMAVSIAYRQIFARWSPAAAVAAAVLAVTAAADAHFLVRFLPVANTSLTLDPEARIRNNYYSDPEVGALAALARAEVQTHERVGVIAHPSDWFSGRIACFNLAPRRCVLLDSEQTEHLGISGVGRLRDQEIDVVVSFCGEEGLPAGFIPVARVTPRALIARRP